MLTFIGLSTNFWDLRRRSLCFFVSHSTKKVPFLSRLIDLSLPEIRARKPLSVANGDNLVTGGDSPLTPPKENEDNSFSLSLSHSPSPNHCQKSCPHVVFLFLGPIVMFFFISFYPLPTRHRVQQGDVNFSPDIRRSDTRVMDKIYSGARHPRLTPVKHPHKRGATNRLVRPGLPDLPSS